MQILVGLVVEGNFHLSYIKACCTEHVVDDVQGGHLLQLELQGLEDLFLHLDYFLAGEFFAANLIEDSGELERVDFFVL